MREYAIFLRGVNVGGIRVPMNELRQCLQSLPVQDIKTYLQSGNVTLSSNLASGELKEGVEKALTERFKYSAHVLIFLKEKLASVVAAWPFGDATDKHRYAIFCGSQATVEELVHYASELDPSVERIAAGDQVVYWQAPKGSDSNTVFNKIISKSRYKAITTNRNLNTIEKMIAR